ncbi:MAG: anti-sigma factor [Cocleimonas sp.]|nr:anti-sigma factor [Cocleimonas sp.]
MSNNIKRYQNPEIFEQLAIEYVVGGLHGRARKRFETLMETHFYLKATVEAYELKFAHLVELLPDEKPSKQLWSNLEAHINTETEQTSETVLNDTKTPWWNVLVDKKSYAFIASLFVLVTALIINPFSGGAAIAYTAILTSKTEAPMAVTRVSQSNMHISINMMKQANIPDDMQLALWCHPRHGGKPKLMGVISTTGETIIKIDKEEWNSFKDVGLLAISVESKNAQSPNENQGEILLKGQLSSLYET